ncbi:Imm50 family immunity protein [Streptomyces sp. NPDC059447]|uniref:Imm50 family immunity protein n=1 Tax=Streptomyces sp. NPDC059447 TaxID=3346834 RepID=UPI0036B988DA
MTASRHWPELRLLYGTAQPPDPGTCALFYVHIDERNTSVTFGFETPQLPPYPKPEWSAKPYNTLRFFVEFTDVTDFRMAGILAEAERSFRIAEDTSGFLDVAVVGDRREISFRAAASRVTQIRVELQGGV